MYVPVLTRVALCFTWTALAQPRRALDPPILARPPARACVCVTFWGTSRTSLPGRGGPGRGPLPIESYLPPYAQWHIQYIHGAWWKWYIFKSLIDTVIIVDSRTLSSSTSPCIQPWQLMLRTNWKSSRYEVPKVSIPAIWKNSDHNSHEPHTVIVYHWGRLKCDDLISLQCKTITAM